MNKNQMKGSAKEFFGKARETTGKALGSKEIERKGKKKRYAGKGQKAVGDLQATVNRKAS